jgi:DNA-binding CsgD family transcriptional regulator
MRQSVSGVLDWRGVWVILSDVSRAANAAGLTAHSVVSSQARIWEFNDPDHASTLMKNFERAKKEGVARFSVQSNVGGIPETWDVLFQRVPGVRLVHVHAVESQPARRLSKTDVDVLRWLSRGLLPSAIARKLKAKTNTIQHRIQRLRKKLGVSTTPALIAAAARHGLID